MNEDLEEEASSFDPDFIDWFLSVQNEDELRKKEERAAKERNYTHIAYLRRRVKSNPCIAFDLFSGVSPSVRGWSHTVCGISRCRSCGRPARYKPADDCSEMKHYQQWERRKRASRLHMQKKRMQQENTE